MDLNIIIVNGFIEEEDKELIFQDEDVVMRSPLTDIHDLLLELGSFPSKSQARKNWKGPKTIPDGFSEFSVGKLRRKLTIWNPTESKGR